MTIGFKCLNENGTYQWLNRNKTAQLRFAECAKLLGTSFIRSDIFPSCRLRFLYFICMDWFDTRKLHSLIGIPLWASLRCHPCDPRYLCSSRTFDPINVWLDLFILLSVLVLFRTLKSNEPLIRWAAFKISRKYSCLAYPTVFVVMADENAKEWTPVCVASTRRHERELSPINPSRLPSTFPLTVQSEPGTTSGDQSTGQDADLSYFNSAEW